MRRITRLIIMILLSVLSVSGRGQVREIELWPDGVPNQHPGVTGEKTLVDPNQVVTHVSEVTRPAITVYPAKGEKGQKSKAVIICPGGGYSRLSIEKEGHAIARFLSENGITGIVLKNRLPDDRLQPDKTTAPLMDVHQAIRMVRKQAELWGIDSSRIGVMGFSAGGHLAASAATHQPYVGGGGENLRPDFSILIYPVISMKASLTHGGSRERLLGKEPSEQMVLNWSNEELVSPQTPPTFMVHAFDDKAVPIENTLNYLQKLRQAGVVCEAHLYKSGGHGFGMLPGPADSWPGLLVKWIEMLK